MTDHDASLRQQALYTIRAGTEEERRCAAAYLHTDLQELASRFDDSAHAQIDRLWKSKDRAVEEMARSMFEGLDRALSRGDDATGENQKGRDDA